MECSHQCCLSCGLLFLVRWADGVFSSVLACCFLGGFPLTSCLFFRSFMSKAPSSLPAAPSAPAIHRKRSGCSNNTKQCLNDFVIAAPAADEKCQQCGLKFATQDGTVAVPRTCGPHNQAHRVVSLNQPTGLLAFHSLLMLSDTSSLSGSRVSLCRKERWRSVRNKFSAQIVVPRFPAIFQICERA